ncbi:hypothetical protein F441_22927 [Phytophthora nicotianae CJ01A1]|uniref:Uncharacterized protein n=1 Tax=Phytophthora nicotianae CJ01A1 TaxID=1317063 RepID=W2VPR2_PHYNI|nr:hypothetical protein F441_22927 [Phytophthora nicotianae CJ01A1]
MCHNEASSVTAQVCGGTSCGRTAKVCGHSAFTRLLKLRQSLEEANVTTWQDLMDPSGI